jgi:hypothetical protein
VISSDLVPCVPSDLALVLGPCYALIQRLLVGERITPLAPSKTVRALFTHTASSPSWLFHRIALRVKEQIH